MTAEGFDHLPGSALPAGDITIPDEEKQALDSVLGGTTSPGPALHPLHAYIATQRGIGVGVEELCALADFDVADGPMIGSMELDFSRPLRSDLTYRVEGEIVDIERKRGKTAGTFDLFTFRERLIEPDGTVAATVTNTFVLPRRNQ